MSEQRTYHNPVQRGFFPDPSVIRVGDDYYMVNSSFQYFPAIPISHSRDMVHWHIIGHAITNPEWLDISDIRDSHGIWAPDIEYVDGKYYIYVTLRLNADGKRDNNVMRRQLVMVSDKPEGPYSKPVCLEVDDIDPSLFVDDDGSRYMIIAKAAQAVPLTADGLAVAGPAKTAWEGTGERCSEGPHIMKKDGYYYAIVAEGGTGYGHGINVGRSKNFYGPYECSPYNPVMRQKDPAAPIQRAGHGKLVQDQNGQWWCYYLCGRPNGGKYTTDTRLNLEWEFVRNPDNGSWSLTERPGYFRIWTRDGQLNEIRAKNTLLRREQELSYVAETKLEFYPDKDGEQAGLTCYYSTATYARCSLCYEGGRKIQLVINRNHGEELMAEVDNVKEDPVYLKVVVEKLTRAFYYSYDGENWELVDVLENCIYICDEGVPDDPKRHTGTLVGIYANNGGCGSRKAADFDYFKYED